MSRTLKVAVVAFVFSLLAHGQSNAPNNSALPRLQFLLGEWTASGDTQLGAGQGGFSFRPELGGRIVVRQNFAEYKTGKAAGTRHEDLMVIYTEQPAKAQAIYFDSEGHVIRYNISFVAENKAVFESEESQPGPRYRLTYSLAGPVLNGKFEMAPSGGSFKTYLEWKSERLSEKHDRESGKP
jgi:hypothetical protein